MLSERATLLLPTSGWDPARVRLEEIVGRRRGADGAECRDELLRSFVSERE
ncbi:MAG: hypothetical protein K0V04_35820 [Deltaproteobacteria bacterium]|nr:hypothetical protein [Deltaproteobacteria bacterium]